MNRDAPAKPEVSGQRAPSTGPVVAPSDTGTRRALHSVTPEQALDVLATERSKGLTSSEVVSRRLRYGENWLERRGSRSVLSLLIEQVRSLIVWLLFAAAMLSIITNDIPEAVAIICVLLINTAIGFFTSWRAVRSMDALFRLADIQALVLRDGNWETVSARELVPGDVVALSAGDVVPADMRLIETVDARCDESTLTGESVPVHKATAPVDADSLVADRTCMAYKGTALVRGNCTGLVTLTGMETELGRISALALGSDGHAFPLEKRLDQLGVRLVWVAVGLSAMVAVIGIARQLDPIEMIETAIALAVAAVPEGLPIVATLALARGMLRMARRNTLIERLSAVETLGATTIILTDKTGTLTENRMTVAHILLPGARVDLGGALAIPDLSENPDLRLAVETAALCNSVSLESGEAGQITGDPMEVALVRTAQRAGVDVRQLHLEWPEEHRFAFDETYKAMATVHRKPEHFHFAVKGAPEKILSVCTGVVADGKTQPLNEALRGTWAQRINENAAEGYRMLGLAMKESDHADDKPYQDLVLIGFVCFVDPLRADVPGAIALCQRAGVRVVMMTGDHADTARTIAVQAGLASDDTIDVLGERDLRKLDIADPDQAVAAKLQSADVFARVTPETKLKVVRHYQKAGHVVAMTGDGVNDAPALKQADIGIAMGQRGTQVARDAAAMILTDDAFPSIVAAMHQGRIIFANIRRFVTYLISCNISEILVVGLAILAGMPVPLTPLQILFLNLVTDVFPAFALGIGEGSPTVMNRPPRDPAEPMIDTRRWIEICLFGTAITLSTLGVFAWVQYGLDRPLSQSVTAAFLTLALAQLWHVFNMRGAREGMFVNSVTGNPYVWGALAICLAIIAAACLIPDLAVILNLDLPGGAALILIVAASFVPLIGGQAWLLLRRDFSKPRRAPVIPGTS